jgi:hypothetical protein
LFGKRVGVGSNRCDIKEKKIIWKTEKNLYYSGFFYLNSSKKLWKMINVHHMYNKGTTLLSHGVGPTHCGIHPM